MSETTNYADTPAGDLRRACREKARATGHMSSWTIGATKDECIAYLATGVLPSQAQRVSETLEAAASGSGNAEAQPASSGGSPPSAGSMDEKSIRFLVDKAVSEVLTRKLDTLKSTFAPDIQVTIDGKSGDGKAPPLVHEAVPDVLKVFEAGLSAGAMLVGPAGSGKTTIAEHVAAILGLGFTFNSLSGGTTEGSLFGRLIPDETGAFKFKRSAFVETWANGGIHLFDEIDAADSNVLVAINAALANGQLALPDGESGERVLKRHPLCFIVAAANTFGRGADRMYVGRNALDAATLDRWSVSTIEVDYDTRIERLSVDGMLPGRKDAQAWIDWCWETRKRIEKAKLRKLMSTRTIINGARLLKVGRTLPQVQESYVLGWTEDEKAKGLPQKTDEKKK
jgi:cobaltochelatase CobS